MRTQPLGWLATFGISLAVVVCACIPTGARIPSMAPGTPSSGPGGVLETASPTAPGPSGRPSFVYPTATPLPTFLVYTVRRGDTLTSIARAHATTARSIAFWNRGRYPSLDPDSPQYAPNRIEVGWELVLIPEVELDPEDLPEPSTSPSATTSG